MCGSSGDNGRKWQVEDIADQSLPWEKDRPDYKPLFSLLDGLSQAAFRRFWIEQLEASEHRFDTKNAMRQANTDIKIVLQISKHTLTSTEEYTQ